MRMRYSNLDIKANPYVNDIKPIETRYKGYRFRSRLEARWAVYFDYIGCKWEYEKEGYNLGKEYGLYLPDFWLSTVNMWAEVKPGTFTAIERKKCKQLARMTGRECLMLFGLPEPTVYEAYSAPFKDSDGRRVQCRSNYAIVLWRYFSRPQFIECHPEWDPGYCRLKPDREVIEIYEACQAARTARFEFGENR